MSEIAGILNSVATLIVAIGAVVVLFKISALITTLADHIKQWKD